MQTVTIAGKLTLPLEDGGPLASFDLGATFNFTQRINDDRVYTAAVANDPVSLGTMAGGGAKLLFIKSPLGGCSISVNGGAAIAIAPAAGYYLVNNPALGIVTSLTVTVTGAATVKIIALA